MAEQASSLLGTESQPPGPETEYKHVPASIAHSISSPSKSGSGTLSIPSPLKRSKTRLLSGILVDLILGGAAVLFLVLAILVRIHDNEPVAENRRLVSSLQEAMQYGSTLFPILFAAAVSRGLRSLMLWRLQRGASIGLLDMLADSTTVFIAIATQFNLRTPTIFGLLLVLIWGLSPVGSQASLRIMSTADSYTEPDLTLQYTDTTFWFLDFYDSANKVSLVNALFTASLLSPAATKRSSMGTWGKMKIPMIETLDNIEAAEGGWKTVPANATYSSLSGLYMSAFDGSRNMTVTLETSYMVAECPVVQNSFPYSMNVSWQTGPSAKIYSPSSRNMSDGTGVVGRNATTGLQPRIIYYDTGMSLPKKNPTQQYDFMDPAANCTLQTSYVEVEAHCVGRRCSAARMRPSLSSHNNTAWTVLDGDRTWNYWAYNFVNSVYGHDARATPKETYFVDPYSPGSPSCSDAQLDTVTGSQAFGISLTQLINTYWLSNAGPELTTNSLGTPSTQVCYQIQPPPNPKMTCAFVLDAPATETTSVEIIVCHRGWLAAIITASAVIIAATVLHVATVLDRKFGDLLFNMSAIVRNDAHIAPMQISSTIEDADLSRLLRRMEVRLDDIRPTNDVGHIGIGTLAGGRKADRLRKGRLYH